MNPAVEPLLRLEGITRSFPGVLALDGVNFTLRRGEIHALMGENGAGKSTLIKVLTGVCRRDAGTINMEGRLIDPHSPAHAQTLGISTVYQEVNLIPHLSVAENITLGRQPRTFGLVNWRRIAARAVQALSRVGVTVDVREPLASYSIAVQQLVAIARALDISANVLVLDEPTSSLDAGEVQQLFAVMRRLKQEGLGIIFVTHFLDQVHAIADRITVLRNGRHVGEFEAGSLDRLGLISKMLGKEVSEPEPESARHRPTSPDGRPVLLEARRMGRRGSVNPLDLTIREGEVVGLAGLLGSGRTETARLLFGIDQPDCGSIDVDGRAAVLRSPRDAIALGFGFCSEDRKTGGIIPNLSVRENIILALQANRGLVRYLSRTRQDELASKYIKALNIATPDAEKPIKLLSGGNQQKVLLARWLAAHPRFLILDEPTRGIDVGAKVEVEKLIASLAEEGMAILFISSELEEVARSSCRVVILRDRKKITELIGAEISEPSILNAIARPE